MASDPNKKPLSISLSSSKIAKKPPSSSSSQSKRGTDSLPHRSSGSRKNHFQDHSDDDEDDPRIPTHEEVTAFDRDAGGAIGADRDHAKKKEQLVIKVESNNNWRDRGRRKGKNLLPREVQAQREAEKGVEGKVVVEKEGPAVEYGLSYAKRTEGVDGQEGGDVAMVDAEVETTAEPAPRKELTEDEIALQSLVGNGEQGRRSDLVIGGAGAQDDDDEEQQQDETTSFREDVASRPDPASLDQYAAVPVEEFGAALLRGMGWKEGQPVGRGNYASGGNANGAKPRVPERRPGYLGIGAKDIGGKMGAEAEIGAWGKAAMRKSKKGNGSSGEGLYLPVMMKQKGTGELITEDEFRALSKGAEGKEDDWKERRDRNLEKNGRDRRRDYDDDYDDYDRNKRSSSRRDRSRSSDRKDRDSRRRRRDDSEDRESDRAKDDRHYRDREGYRDRDRDRGSDRKHRDSRRHRDDHESRPSSSSHSSRRDRRDRDRDSDRGSHRKRDRYGDEDRRRSSKRGEVY